MNTFVQDTMQAIKTFLSTHPDALFIANLPIFLEKCQLLLQGGLSSLHVISDFDMTLTKYWVDGKRSISSHGILERYSKMPPDFKSKTAQLYAHYYPIEIDHSLPFSEKRLAMEEWWSQAHELIIQLGLTRSDLSLMIKENSVTFRPGFDAFVNQCDSLKVPLLIFSAGIAGIFFLY